MTKTGQSIIFFEQYLYCAKKIIIKKDCTLADLERAEELLNKCRLLADATETRADIWFGKLELKRSNITRNGLNKQVSLANAKNSFFMSLTKKPTPSAFNGLFKIAIDEKDWISAKEYLKYFEKSDRKNKFNYTLVHRVLDTCIGIKGDYPIILSGYIFSNKINYAPLRDNYRLAEEAFANEKYHTCLKHLLVCKKLAERKSVTTDFNPLISMVTQILELKNMTALAELKQQIASTTNNGEKIILIRKLLSISPNEVELYFMLIDSYIELGVYSCIDDILEQVMQLELSAEDIKRIAYYRGLFEEQVRYTKHIVSISNSLIEGEAVAARGEVLKAYNIFINGFKNSGNSVFISKIGDLFYQNGYYVRAKEYYLKYLETGFEHRLNVYINLYKTYRRMGHNEQAIMIAREAFGTLFLATRGYSQDSWCLELANIYENELNDEIQDERDNKKLAIN